MFQHVQTCANLAEVPAVAFIAGALVMATFHRRPRRQASEGLWDMQTFEHAAKHDWWANPYGRPQPEIRKRSVQDSHQSVARLCAAKIKCCIMLQNPRVALCLAPRPQVLMQARLLAPEQNSQEIVDKRQFASTSILLVVRSLRISEIYANKSIHVVLQFQHLDDSD